jgi:hypothetical protein
VRGNKGSEGTTTTTATATTTTTADPTNTPQLAVFFGFPMRPFLIYQKFAILYPQFFIIIYL